MIQYAESVAGAPDAVFVRRTRAKDFTDREHFREAGYALASALLTRTDGAEARTFVLKPNVVAGPDPKRTPEGGSDAGIVTDPDFVGGIVTRLQELGASRILIAEGGGPTPMGPTFAVRGYTRMAEEHGVELVDLNREPGGYADDELVWSPVEDGVVFREIPFVLPVNGEDTVFINVPTMKTHNLGVISLCAKALQGTIAMGYRHFCGPLERALDQVPGARQHYLEDAQATIQREFQRHVKAGYPLWDKEGQRYEEYAQRTCDAVQAHRGFLCMVEGVIGRDGTAFHHGKDILANLTVGGVNPVHVDAVTAYLMGHDPRNIGYLKVAEERGLGKIDPADIPVYLLDEDGPRACERLADLERVELGVYFRGDNSHYVFF